jgi:tRNA (guanine-N7-)-methyltransferase
MPPNKTMTPERNDDSQPVYGPLRSFGRRRSRKLSPRQAELLDEGLNRLALDVSVSAPDRLSELFDWPVREVWLEIGFGGGEHLLWQARHNPDVGIIACEPFIDGVVKVLDGARADDLNNIRIYTDDVRDVLPWLPSASVNRAFVLFPDPWPKKRHIKRRLVGTGLIGELARIMTPDAELRLATDIPDYARGMLLAVRQQKSFRWLARERKDWRIRPNDWPPTRYEEKAIREGRSRYFFQFRNADSPNQ